jgi:pyruvate kinase
MSHTGIICTIGPASSTAAILGKMIDAGMSVARLNFSHGGHEEHRQRIRSIRSLEENRLDRVGILQDLEGFRIRIGSLPDSPSNQVEVSRGETVYLGNGDTGRDPQVIPLDYRDSLEAIGVGDLIHIDDGSISLRAVEVAENLITCEVLTPGTIKEHKGVNIPQAQFPFSGLSEKDERDIDFGIENRVDFIAQSFVRNGRDITDIRERLNQRDFNCKLIAKIENREGIRNLDEIMEVAVCIMGARGSLGVSLPIYEVPVLQKIRIKECRKQGKFAITAVSPESIR